MFKDSLKKISFNIPKRLWNIKFIAMVAGIKGMKGMGEFPDNQGSFDYMW